MNGGGKGHHHPARQPFLAFDLDVGENLLALQSAENLRRRGKPDAPVLQQKIVAEKTADLDLETFENGIEDLDQSLPGNTGFFGSRSLLTAGRTPRRTGFVTRRQRNCVRSAPAPAFRPGGLFLFFLPGLPAPIVCCLVLSDELGRQHQEEPAGEILPGQFSPGRLNDQASFGKGPFLPGRDLQRIDQVDPGLDHSQPVGIDRLEQGGEHTGQQIDDLPEGVLLLLAHLTQGDPLGDLLLGKHDQGPAQPDGVTKIGHAPGLAGPLPFDLNRRDDLLAL